MLNQLRDLVRRYIAGEIGRDEFRRVFVREFSAIADNNAGLSRVYDHVESAFSALDNGIVAEDQFREYLHQFAPPVLLGRNVVVYLRADQIRNQGNVGRIYQFAANQVSSLSVASSMNSNVNTNVSGRRFGELVELTD